MEDKSAPQEGPREGAAPASPGAGPNSPLQAANKRDATPKAEAPQNSPGSLRDITNAADDAFWAAAADAASQAENDLEEFYALADFANPGVLGPPEAFRRGFARPIAAGLARGADPDEVAIRERKQAVLAEVATRFLLRRENRLNAAHLPRKLVQVVVCRATAAQRAAYGAVLADKRLRHALRGKQADVLASIGKLQKICNHPCARPRCICVRV